MPEQYQPQDASLEMATIVRDLEEKHRLLRDRVVLLGQTLVNERDKTFKEVQEIKKDVILLKEETKRIKELLERITEQLSGLARKDELMILQRQFDLFREA